MKFRLITSPLIATSLLAFALGCGGGKKDPVEACLDGSDKACESLYYDGYYDDYYSLKIQDGAALDSSCADVEFQNKAYTNGRYDAASDECTWTGDEDTLTCPVSGGDCSTNALD